MGLEFYRENPRYPTDKLAMENDEVIIIEKDPSAFKESSGCTTLNEADPDIFLSLDPQKVGSVEAPPNGDDGDHQEGGRGWWVILGCFILSAITLSMFFHLPIELFLRYCTQVGGRSNLCYVFAWHLRSLQDSYGAHSKNTTNTTFFPILPIRCLAYSGQLRTLYVAPHKSIPHALIKLVKVSAFASFVAGKLGDRL
jgi:hypothetical protein